MRPEGVAAAGIDHQLDAGADRLAGGADQQFVGVRVAAAERLPTQLDRLETAGRRLPQLLPQPVRLVEEERAVGFDAVAVDAAE